MELKKALSAYEKTGIYPLHMPGHKRNADFFPPHGWHMDITEIEGFDDLHHAQGILARGMEQGAQLYGSKKTYYLINGSTCGLLAGISAAAPKDSRVLVARNCHKAVYHALYLRELEPVYLLPMEEQSWGIAGSISPASVAEALEKHEDIRLIILTSPTYEGILSDVSAIARLAHARGIPLLVDEAHGAHLGFSPHFPPNSLKNGADIVIHSLHKTLPALTQSALLHLQGNLVDEEEVQRFLSVFQSSSPSYLLMAGIEHCLTLLKQEGAALFQAYWERLCQFRQGIQGLKQIQVFDGSPNRGKNAAVYAFDAGKILISLKKTALNGMEFKKLLLKEYGLELEMAFGDLALAMTSICDTEEGFHRLKQALLKTDAALAPRAEVSSSYSPCFLPPQAMPMHLAAAAGGAFCPLQQSAGGISQEYLYAYPPGMPMLTPGEQITPALLEYFCHLERQGIALKSSYGRAPAEIKLVLQDAESVDSSREI